MAMPTTPTTRDAGRNDFLQFLSARGALAQEQADRLRVEAEQAGIPAHQFLQEGAVLPEETLYRLRAEFLKMPFFALQKNEMIPPEILRNISEEAARRYNFVPLQRDGKTLHVGMVSPEDTLAQEALRFLLSHAGLRAKIFLISPATFEAIFAQYQPFRSEVEEALTELDETLSEQKAPVQPSKRKSEELYQEAPIIKMVAVILRQAIEGGASDVHIEPGPSRLRVRFRVDGILYTSLFLPMSVHAAMVSRVKILASLKLDETRLAQDGRFRSVVDKQPIDFRVATLPTAFGEKASIRVLDPSIGLRSFDDLGLMGYSYRALKDSLTHPFGMILATGPTGSGKTTTLYSILQTLRRDEINIVTLEDPIEYFIDGVNQSQVNEDIGYAFANGLRHILRGDPNIIMVGEIRDHDTAQLAVHAALTGHLVLSTLHTNNAAGVIPRLLDLGVDPFLVPSTLVTAVAQRLVRTLCSSCRKPRALHHKERLWVEKSLSSLGEEERIRYPNPNDWHFWEAPGCDVCGRSGTKGRVAIYEVLRMTRELEAIILTGPSGAKIEDEARRQGMVTMLQDGISKALFGQIAVEELLRVVEEEEGA